MLYSYGEHLSSKTAFPWEALDLLDIAIDIAWNTYQESTGEGNAVYIKNTYLDLTKFRKYVNTLTNQSAELSSADWSKLTNLFQGFDTARLLPEDTRKLSEAIDKLPTRVGSAPNKATVGIIIGSIVAIAGLILIVKK